MKKHVHPSVQYKLSDIDDSELKERLEQQFLAVEAQKTLQVEAMRSAERAAAMAMKAMAEVKLAEIDFLIAAGDAFDMVRTEPSWMIRRQREGGVVLECLLTQNDIENITRVQTKKLREQAEKEIDDSDTGGMFGE
jgi:isoleucyl-tRNA synthetase